MIQITQTNHIEEQDKKLKEQENNDEEDAVTSEKVGDDDYNPEIILKDIFLDNANDLTNVQLQLKEVVDKIRAIDDEDTDYGKGCINFSCPHQRKSSLFDSLIDAIKKNENALMLEIAALRSQISSKLSTEDLKVIATKIEENKKIKELYAKIKIYHGNNESLKKDKCKLKGRISTLTAKVHFKEKWERDDEYQKILQKIKDRGEDLRKVSNEVHNKRQDVKALNYNIRRLTEQEKVFKSTNQRMLSDLEKTGILLENKQKELAKIEAKIAMESRKIVGIKKRTHEQDLPQKKTESKGLFWQKK